MSEETSVRCEEHQCRKVKRCRDCGVAPGQTHHYWCRYYPDLPTNYQKQSDDEDYRVYF